MFKAFLSAICLCCLLAGCRNAAPPAGTGARVVVAKYFEALIQQDWELAYAQLHADTQKRLDRKAFERNGRIYCKQLGFPLGKAFLRSCDEQGEKAIAQIILSDVNGSMKHRFHEGVVLQHGDNGWGIILPSNFGPER
jgi:hypothetical protein